MQNIRTLGTLLRHLNELLDNDVERTYREAGLVYRPRYTPVVRLLTEQGPSTIRAISNYAGITHSAASQTVAEMVKRGLVRGTTGKDARERIISLTEAAEALLPQLRLHWDATNKAAEQLSSELGGSLDEVIEEAIAALDRRSFYERIRDERARIDRGAAGSRRKPRTTKRASG